MSTKPMAAFFVLALAVGACNQPRAGTGTAATGDAASAPSVPRGQDSLVMALAEANRLKDSLLVSVFAADSFIDQVGAEISKVKSLSTGMVAPQVSGETTGSANVGAYRQQLIERLKEITNRLQRAENRLAANHRQLRELTKDNAFLKEQLAGYEQTIANFSAKISTQQAQIDSMAAAIGLLESERNQLAAEKAVLTDTVAALITRENAAYYIIGTKDDLKNRGLIVQEGKKFLFLGKKSWQSARSIDPSGMERIDLRETTTITLPNPDKWYRIVSRQNPDYVEADAVEHGKYRGKLRITSPRDFWANSKYLIIVED